VPVSERVDVNRLGLPNPSSVRIAGRSYVPGADKGVGTLLTASSWLLARLPSLVVERQCGALIRALAEARDLVVEVHTKPAAILIRDGERALLEIPATR
jgi:hypothetical protein